MPRELTFTDPGEGIHEGEIIDVLVSVGDEVDEGDAVLIVETDKATTDLPAPYSGEVRDVHVEPGDVVEVGDVLMTFSGDGDGSARRERPSAEEREGEGGKAAAVGELPTEEEQPAAAREKGPATGDGGPVPAAPATRRLARELGVDLRVVDASGPHGRVTAGDVRAAAAQAPPEERPAEEPRPGRPLAVEAPPLPDFEHWGPVERVPLRGVRRTTAQRMTTSWQQIPHVTHHDVADIMDLERWRREQAPAVKEAGGDLTLMVIVMKAVAGLLQRHPRFNASLDPEAGAVVLKRHYHIGIAVDTDDGLVVPVARDVDRKPLGDLAVEASALIKRVRAREVGTEDLQGGTFTITNVGPLGGTAFTPLIRHPEVAVLGMARARLEPVVTGDLDQHDTEVRLRLPLALGFDHRVNDGADAARFVGDLVAALSDPGSLLLNV